MATAPADFDDYEEAISKKKTARAKEENKALYKALIKNRKDVAKERAENVLEGGKYYTRRIKKVFVTPTKQSAVSKRFNSVIKNLASPTKTKYPVYRRPVGQYKTQYPSYNVNGFPRRENQMQNLLTARQKKMMMDIARSGAATAKEVFPMTPDEENMSNYIQDLRDAATRMAVAQSAPQRRVALRQQVIDAQRKLSLMATKQQPEYSILNAPAIFNKEDFSVTGVDETNILKAKNIFAKSDNNPSILSNFRNAKSILNTKDANNNINFNDNIFSASNPNRWDIMKKRPVEGW